VVEAQVSTLQREAQVARVVLGGRRVSQARRLSYEAIVIRDVLWQKSAYGKS